MFYLVAFELERKKKRSEKKKLRLANERTPPTTTANAAPDRLRLFRQSA